MKKVLLVLVIVVSLFSLSSCYDYLQSISYSNGKYKFYYKITVAKAMFTLSQSEYNENEFLDMLNQKENAMPDDVVVNKVDNDSQIGVECFFEVDPLNPTEETRRFLPTKSGDKCYIPFLLGNENGVMPSDVENDELGLISAICSCARNQILIGKNVIPTISTAYFEGSEGSVLPIDVYDYGNCYCFDIPIAILLDSHDYCLNRIVVRR